MGQGEGCSIHYILLPSNSPLPFLHVSHMESKLFSNVSINHVSSWLHAQTSSISSFSQTNASCKPVFCSIILEPQQALLVIRTLFHALLTNLLTIFLLSYLERVHMIFCTPYDIDGTIHVSFILVFNFKRYHDI